MDWAYALLIFGFGPGNQQYIVSWHIVAAVPGWEPETGNK
jgi:hypothetical protein